jgi:tRNA(Ile)-lysidine synthase
VLETLLARCQFPDPPGPVHAAVSGGADSLALLVLARAAGLEVTAIHVDHGLRPASGREADVVRRAAARFGADFVACAVKVGAGPDLEARARRARYEALPSGVLTGHTADDQAETVLLNLVRGAGLDGLSGMRRSDRVRRPLLGLRRRDTAAVCAEFGLDPVSDPSNLDDRFLRNRVRHRVLPLLDEIAGRDVTAVVARQAGLLADDAALLERLAAEIDPTDAAALSAAPAPLARRAVRAWLRHGDERHPPSAADVERVLAVARGEAVACEVAPGRRVRRSAGTLSVLASRVRAL